MEIQDNSPEDEAYHDDPEVQKPTSGFLNSSFLKVAALAIALVMGTTFAANLRVNIGGAKEFGQGVSIATACSGSEPISIRPVGTFNNSQSKFLVSQLVISRIPSNCLNKDFLLSIYSDTSVISLDTGVDTARVAYVGAQTSRVYSGTSGTNTFGASISAASVTSGYGTFTLDLTGALPPATNLKKISIQSVSAGTTAGGNGTLAAPGENAFQIHKDYPAQPSGLYWVSNPNINSGTPVQIYADMTRNGGGWTLVVANASSNGWDNSSTLLYNQNSPPSDPTYAGAISQSTSRYSILSWADYLKKSESGFQYRLEAETYGKWGGIWTVNQNYSFVSQTDMNTDITLDERFNPGDWNYPVDNSIEARMPFYQPGQCYVLSTTNDNWWWGTIISICGYSPAPWIEGAGAPGADNPGIIWYWVR